MCSVFRVMLRVLQILQIDVLQIDVSQIIDIEFKFYLLIIELASSHIICHVLIICSKMNNDFIFFFFFFIFLIIKIYMSLNIMILQDKHVI